MHYDFVMVQLWILLIDEVKTQPANNIAWIISGTQVCEMAANSSHCLINKINPELCPLVAQQSSVKGIWHFFSACVDNNSIS